MSAGHGTRSLLRRTLGLLALVIVTGIAAAACGLLSDTGFIAYTEGPEGARDISVVRPDGNQLRVVVNHPADDFAPRWSPNGQRLAFLSDRDGNVELYVSPADGPAPCGPPTRAWLSLSPFGLPIINTWSTWRLTSRGTGTST